MKSAQVTVRNVDTKLKQAIKNKAQASGKSVNAWMLDAAREKAGITPPTPNNSWKNLAGSIPMTDQLHKSFAGLRTVNPKDWQ